MRGYTHFLSLSHRTRSVSQRIMQALFPQWFALRKTLQVARQKEREALLHALFQEEMDEREALRAMRIDPEQERAFLDFYRNIFKCCVRLQDCLAQKTPDLSKQEAKLKMLYEGKQQACYWGSAHDEEKWNKFFAQYPSLTPFSQRATRAAMILEDYGAVQLQQLQHSHSIIITRSLDIDDPPLREAAERLLEVSATKIFFSIFSEEK